MSGKLESGEIAPLPGTSVEFLVAGNIFYFVTLAALTLWMSRREPFKLLQFMRLYNLTCVLLAGAVCYGIIEHIIKYRSIAFVGNTKYLDARTEAGAHFNFFMWLYYIQKFWEFLDSFIFILRHKWNQLSFLHVYHHSSICIITFMYITMSGSGDNAFGAFFNAFVHVLMYSHYLCATFGVKTWWKPYLTQLQLVQFFCVATQAFVSLTLPEDQGWPYFLRWVMVFYTFTMIVLFGRFYVLSYMRPSSKADPKKRQ